MTDRPRCPHDHRGWDHPLPLDRIPARYGGGWSCPGILPDGTDCGYETGTRPASAALTGDELAAAASVAAQFYADGLAHGRTPAAGRRLGFDVGYSANTADRAFVHALIAGFEEGCAARHELAAGLLDAGRDRARRAAAGQPRPAPSPARARAAERRPGTRGGAR